MKQVLIVENSVNSLMVKENKGDQKYLLGGVFTEFDVKNRNERIYTADRFLPCLEELNERINAGTLRVGRTWDDQITPYDLGLKFKTGFEIKRGMNMGVYYEMGLTDINPQFVQTYNKVFGVSVSYLFSITQEDKYNRYPDYYHY